MIKRLPLLAIALWAASIAPSLAADDPIVIRSGGDRAESDQPPPSGEIVIRSTPSAEEGRERARSASSSSSADKPPAPSQPSVAPAPSAGASVVDLAEMKPAFWKAQGRGNIRSAPSTASEVVGRVEDGELITVLARVQESDWYAVDFEGTVAYMHEVVGEHYEDIKTLEPKEAPSREEVDQAEGQPNSNQDALCPVRFEDVIRRSS